MLLADPPPNRVLIGQQLGAGGWGDCLEPGLDWMTPKISVKSLARTIKEAGGDVEPSSWMVTRSRQWSPVGPQRPRPRGAPGLALSIWPQLGCYIPRVSPPPPSPQRPCVGRWWRLCYRQHGVAMCVTSPLVIPADGGLYHGYRPVTLG